MRAAATATRASGLDALSPPDAARVFGQSDGLRHQTDPLARSRVAFWRDADCSSAGPQSAQSPVRMRPGLLVSQNCRGPSREVVASRQARGPASQERVLGGVETGSKVDTQEEGSRCRRTPCSGPARHRSRAAFRRQSAWPATLQSFDARGCHLVLRSGPPSFRRSRGQPTRSGGHPTRIAADPAGTA